MQDQVHNIAYNSNCYCLLFILLVSMLYIFFRTSQVMSLNQKGVNSDYLGSTQTNPDVTNNTLNGLYNVLYMTPERAMGLTNRYFNRHI